MSHEEKPPTSKAVLAPGERPPLREDETIGGSVPTAVEKLFNEMPWEDKKIYARQILQRMPKDTFIRTHKVSLTDQEKLFPQGGDTVTDEEDESGVTLTSQNTHIITTELNYRVGAGRHTSEVIAFLQSVCSVADHMHKPYVQVIFNNGTAVFEYKKVGSRYHIHLAPGTVNDFKKTRS